MNSLLGQIVDHTMPCGPPEESSWLCELVESTTGRPYLARAADVLIARPAAVLLIFVTAWVVGRLARRAIGRLVRRVQNAPINRQEHGPVLDVDRTVSVSATRKVQRAEALGTLMTSVAGTVIWGIAILMALDKLGFNLGPLLAGAGVVGIAIGFGAQTLVRDFLSGTFMLVEDQFGVGDVIDVGEASGTVESVTLRITRLRSVDGVVWHVPNGEIRRIGNKSQQWSRALLDVPVPYAADLPDVLSLIQQVADALADDPGWRDRILSRPEVWGVERFDADSIAVRLVVTTMPLEQWPVARELRLRLKDAFTEAGLEIPFPQRTVWLRHEEAVPERAVSRAARR